MLCSAKSHALTPKPTAVFTSLGVSALVRISHSSHFVGPLRCYCQISGESCFFSFDIADVYISVETVERNIVAFVYSVFAGVECFLLHKLLRHRSLLRSIYPCLCHNGSMRCHSSSCSENAFCAVHAFNVFG